MGVVCELMLFAGPSYRYTDPAACMLSSKSPTHSCHLFVCIAISD